MNYEISNKIFTEQAIVQMRTSYTFQENNIFLIFFFQMTISRPQAMPDSGLTATKLIIPSSSHLM